MGLNEKKGSEKGPQNWSRGSDMLQDGTLIRTNSAQAPSLRAPFKISGLVTSSGPLLEKKTLCNHVLRPRWPGTSVKTAKMPKSF